MENITIILIVILLIFYRFRDEILLYIKLLVWKNRHKNKHDYDIEKVRKTLEELGNEFDYSLEEIPYGRAKWYIEGKEAFNNFDYDELIVFGYSPIRSMDELDFNEYGLMLTHIGLLYSYQGYRKEIRKFHKTKKAKVNEAKIVPFDGLWKLEFDQATNQLIFFYLSKEKISLVVSKNWEISSIISHLELLIETGYTKDLYFNSLSQDYIFEKELDNQILKKKSQVIGGLAGLQYNLGNHFHTEQLNAIVNAPQGHGIAAEYANNLVDKVKTPFSRVMKVGQDNAKDGADRIVGDTLIQTKYYSNAKNTVNSAFNKKENGGMYRYSGMQLEVPKEQYQEAIKLMEDKIIQGKVSGVKDPKQATQIIRKGNITWQESKLIAQGGNLISLKYDAINGLVQTSPIAGISFAIVFAQGIWSGNSPKEAAKGALIAGTRTLVLGTAVYAGSQQISKVLTMKMANYFGKKIMAESVAKGSSLVLSFGIVIGPSIFDKLSGRISSQQLLKNTVVASAGLASGIGASALTGMAIGSGLLPGLGTVVGTSIGAATGIIGGVAGTLVTQSVLDKFMDDDRVEMFAILKEEFIDVTMSMSLTESELEEIQTLVFNGKLENKLKTMFSKQNGSRIFARTDIVEVEVVSVIEKRDPIDESQLIEAVDYAFQLI
ncbi:bacteriocin class II family protein [Fundicoccus culcitae]|uniref:Bacteriocin class II family protein n=1 Tax=Fundicoccus culcitae TaxID=2969821 RepID=A0ABY5P7Z8_9LACT|nr:bacteriocin class II family protein [Fundicoccus culcitae]UUX34868.1 bacteriocin class II family protein [Fundicoccus culcitae]